MHLWHDLGYGAGAPRAVDVVVEIPKGGRVKYNAAAHAAALRAGRGASSANVTDHRIARWNL